MEYVDGQLITEYCNARKLSLHDRLSLFLPVCAAVSHAHQHFVVHRDLKPGNILVDREGNPKLVDFGVCKLLYRDTSATSAVTGAEIILTPDYGSPEQVRGEAVTVASDVYSLGAVLYELVTGERVHRFEKLSPQHIEKVICETDITLPSLAVKDRAWARKLEGDIDNILMCALHKVPERRYQSVEQFANDLRNHLGYRPILARRDTLRYRVRKFAHRNRRGLIVGVLTASALIAGVAFSIREARIAQRNFAAARQLANAFVFDVHDQVKDLPGSLRARQTILSLALKYLDSLSADASSDPSLRRELAAAYERVGELQGNVLGSHTGDVNSGLASYSKALALLDPVSPTRAVQLDRALLFDRIGDLQFGIGKTSDALESYRKGLDVARRLQQENPTDNLVRRHVADLHIAIGRLQRESQDLNGSLASMSEGLKLLRQARAAGRELREIQTSEAAALAGVGMAQFGLGKLGEAKESFFECVKRWDHLIAADPLSTFSRRHQMLAYSHLGDVLGNPNYANLDDTKGARAAFDTMTAIARSLHESDPKDAGSWVDYGMALMHSAAVPDQNPVARMALLRNARQVLTDASAANPGNVVPKMNIAAIGEQIGQLLETTGDARGAETEYLASFATVQPLAQTGRISAYRIFVEVSSKLASIAAKRGEREQALDYARKAVDVGERASAMPGVSVQQRSLAAPA
jgi:tetratricopeptide (TPR) repeat protein